MLLFGRIRSCLSFVFLTLSHSSGQREKRAAGTSDAGSRHFGWETSKLSLPVREIDRSGRMSDGRRFQLSLLSDQPTSSANKLNTSGFFANEERFAELSLRAAQSAPRNRTHGASMKRCTCFE